MRKIFIIILIAAAGAGVFASHLASAQDAGQNPFILIILGTRHFSDVDVIEKNVKRMESVKNFSLSVNSQKHIEFQGAYTGKPDDLVADITSLAGDRYDTQSKNDKERGLIITLRKITE